VSADVTSRRTDRRIDGSTMMTAMTTMTTTMTTTRATMTHNAATTGRRVSTKMRGTHQRVLVKRTAVPPQADEKDAGDEKDAAKRDAETKKVLDEIVSKHGGRFTGKVEVVNRGGVVLRAQKGRFRAFLPKSQMRSSRLRGDFSSGSATTAAEDETKSLEGQIGRLIDVKLVDATPKRIVVSERALLQEGAAEKLPVGETVDVVVTSLSDFGAFVEVCDGQGAADGLEGLVHISEISWNRISHPRDAVKVGQRCRVKVLEVNSETGRINFSFKQTQADPLMETLETIMPVTMPEPSIDEDDLSEIPLPGLPDICSSLLKEEGIEAVIPGRQAMEQRVVSQDLELWLTNVFVEDGYNLLARAGRQVQEIHVVTKLDRDSIKKAIKRATSMAKNEK
jgi:predicted RNA-binding protein with RPS1 domain